MFRTIIFILCLYVASATTCSQLKTIYSDAACCANSNIDTCLRTIPVCDSADNGEICTDVNDHAIIKGGVSATIPTASTTVLGGVKVDGSSIIIADGIISAPIGSGSSSTTAFSGDYNDLTNKPTIPTAFSGDYDDLTNKPTLITSYNDLSDKPTIPTAFSGDYDDLTNKPTIPTAFSGDYDDLTNKPTIPTAFSGDYDDLTNKPTIPTAFSGDYNDLTNKPDLSNVGGGGSSSGGVLTKGQVLEILAGACDGRSVEVASDTYTLPTVDQVFQLTAGATYTELPGTFSYQPPANTKQVIYRYKINMAADDRHGIANFKLYVDDVEVTGFTRSWVGEGPGQDVMMLDYTFDIGTTDDAANGKYLTWDSSKTFKIKVREHSDAGHEVKFFSHGYWEGSYMYDSDGFVRPSLEIVAIGEGTSGGGGVAVDNSTIKQHANGTIYVANAPTALVSAQTFEVTSEECASAALRTSIHAQFTAKTNYQIGTEAYFSGSYATMPSGCVFYVDTNAQAYNRIGYNSDTSDPNDGLGYGYSTVTVTLRICKYANGDFVLLTDPTQRCKTVHYTLPDNLGALAGVLQASSTNMGIGISPTAPLHVGTGASTSISASRFECDGSGVIIEQTTGKVENIMSRDDCLQLPNFENGAALPGTTATKYADAVCSSGSSYKTYAYHVIEVTKGPPDLSMNEQECRRYAEAHSYTFNVASVAWGSQGAQDARGCLLTSGSVTWNDHATSTAQCDAFAVAKCLQKLNVKLVASGTNTGSEALSEGECMAWGTLTGRWNRHLAIGSLPPGCMQNGPGLGGTYNHNDASIYWNSGTGSCSDSRYCVMRDTTLDNPGTPNDQHRVNACRDRCSDPTSKIWTGLTYGLLPYHTTPPFTPASFSIEPTGGECTCHAEPASTCQRAAHDLIDLYQLNWRPKGCFKDENSVPGTTYHYWTDTEGGQCSSYYPCLRTDDACLVQDTATETKELSIISEKSAWFKQEVVISSDRRIKENIVDVEHAREKMRLIAAKNYSYIDKRKWNGTTVGFIAQEVAQVMPEAVKVEKGFVPNILKRVKCTFHRNITLNMTCAELLSGRVRLFVTDEDGESLLDVDVNDGVAVVEKVYTQVYAFGYEVEDFHTLEKSKLFALNFAATKELDKEVQLLREEVNAIKQAAGI